MTTLSLYEQVMRDNYCKLAVSVQRFHRLTGSHELHGWVVTEPVTSICAQLLARLLGTPIRVSNGPIRFELHAQSSCEVWTRHFPSKIMTSTFTANGCTVVEHLGASRLTFELTEAAGKLVMKLVALRFWTVPCPKWLMPEVSGEESDVDGKLHFRVRASLPFIGLVAAYHGHLVVPFKDTQ